MAMQSYPVSSSAIKAVKYDDKAKRLLLTFPSGHQYEYGPIDRFLFTSFMASSSKGQFFNREIKGKYEL